MKTIESVSPELKAKLKKSDPEIQAFVDALYKKIIKLLKEKADLEVENIFLNERINSLPSEMKECLEMKKQIGDIPKELRGKLIKDFEKRLHKPPLRVA